jgi:uncharacterized membrane protein
MQTRVARSGALAAMVASSVALAAAAQPQYTIFDLGVVNPADTASQGLGVSPGGVGFGRSLGTSNQAFSWTLSGGRVALTKLAGRTFQVANGANDSGIVVGTGTTTTFGSSPLPIQWTNGVPTQLPLIAGQTLGRANDVNSAGTVVGSMNGGSAEFPVIWQGGTPTAITAPTALGAIMRTAFRINNAGLVAGQGIDPLNAARNAGILYNSVSNTTVDVPPLPGLNGTLPFEVSENGLVVGSSMLNQGSGLPFLWNSAGGPSVAIPLPAGTSQGSARGVNSLGWAVGTASGAFAVPFLFDGTQTYRLQDLIPAGTGWDLSTNTSSSALGISEDGTIIGTGVFNGQVRAYALVIPAPGAAGLLAIGVCFAARRRR